jgi:hypothetical protein
MATVVLVPGEDELPVGEPAQQRAEQQLQQLGRSPVRPTALAVVLRGAIQGDQHRQGPGAAGEREAHQDGQDDPLVAPAPGGVGVAGADRVAVPGLAVDFATGMLGDRVIADQADPALGPEVPEEEAGQEGGQGQAGPRGQGEDAVVAGGSAVGQAGDGAQQVADGAAAGGDDGGHAQELGADEGGGRGEGGREQGEHGQLRVGYTTHEGLRMGRAWMGFQPSCYQTEGPSSCAGPRPRTTKDD